MEATIRALNVFAELKVTTHSRADPAWLLNVDRFAVRTQTINNALFSSLQSQSGNVCLPCAPQKVHSAAVLVTVGIELPGQFDMARLSKYLDALLFGKAMGAEVVVYRAKGVLRLASQPYLHILQSVHEVFDIQPCDILDSSEASNKVILIGRNLQQSEIERGFRSCLV